jgi:hypothetical protein
MGNFVTMDDVKIPGAQGVLCGVVRSALSDWQLAGDIVTVTNKEPLQGNTGVTDVITGVMGTTFSAPLVFVGRMYFNSGESQCLFST